MRGFKGFDKDMKCRDQKFEEGKEYKQDDKPEICNKGYHFCENPFDVFTYYFNGATFAEVEAIGDIDKKENEDSKRATNHIKIVKKLALKELIKVGYDYIRTLAKISKVSNVTAGNSAHSSTAGDYAHSSTAGYYAHSSTAGDYAHSSTAGNYAHSSTAGNSAHSSTAGNSAHSSTAGDSAHSSTAGYSAHSSTAGDSAHSSTAGDSAHSSTAGKESIAVAIGINNQAKSIKGNWLVLSEWKQKDNKWVVKSVETVKVDGKKIKADTWYKLENGKFVEVK